MISTKRQVVIVLNDYLFLSISNHKLTTYGFEYVDLSTVQITQIEMKISIQDLLLLFFNSAFNQKSNNREQQLFRRTVSKVMKIKTTWID